VARQADGARPPCAPLDQKKALYAAIADNLSRDPGLRREDIFINLIEVKKENWSFGAGEAQYA
jgi:4-oxalocrotonate tautomerase